MISKEPKIRIGLMEGQPSIEGQLTGSFGLEGESVSGPLRARAGNGSLELSVGGKRSEGREFEVRGEAGSSFVIRNVTIGIQFHWERKEDQTFRGDLRLVSGKNGLTLINEIGVEEYLTSVISSEMSADSPRELLKAHAITSRSWLVAMLDRQKRLGTKPSRRGQESESEVLRWYDREDHADFDVCADDHCQRYQGIANIIPSSADAVEETRGIFLVYDDTVCDARFSKACGGITETFENVWEETPVPYLQSVPDSEIDHPALVNEESVRQWITASPKAFCNTSDPNVLRTILPSFDQETADFFRWKVEYTQEQLSEVLRSRSGYDFGSIIDLIPVQRGPSGRIIRLRIVGTKKTIVVGKELEIRKWLSTSHLYSSAFNVEKEGDRNGHPERWILRGAGWGHGVGLCQIGAAVMAMEGKTSEQILRHYFRNASLKKFY